MDDCLRLCSLNTRGLRDNKKRVGLFHWLKRHKSGNSSFVFLQETHSDTEQETRWKREWGANIIFSHGESNARGVAILCPMTMVGEIVKVDRDTEGRLIIVELNDDGRKTLLCNVYAPTQDQGFHQSKQIAFLKVLNAKLLPYVDSDTCIILGGDLNTHLDPKLDKQHSSNDKKFDKTEFANSIINFCNDFSLVDCWRILHLEQMRYTWRQPNPIRQSRLDYWLISSSLLNRINISDIQPSYKSDHSLITLEMKPDKPTRRGPGMWKFNVSLLKDPDYVNGFNGWLMELKETYENLEDKALKWDFIKCVLRRETITYCKQKAKKRKELFVQLSESLSQLESELADNASTDLMQEYQVVKQELDNIVSLEAQGKAFRSKAKYIEFNEKILVILQI